MKNIFKIFIEKCFDKRYNKYIKNKEGGIFMISALTVSNNFIDRALKENIELTPMKLQKLLYFLYARYFYENKEPLFKERFATWQYGPVIPEVYDVFSHFKANDITSYHEIDNEVFIATYDNEIFKSVFDLVWGRFKGYNGTQLSNLTHVKESAWSKADKNKKGWLLDADIVVDGDIFFE